MSLSFRNQGKMCINGPQVEEKWSEIKVLQCVCEENRFVYHSGRQCISAKDFATVILCSDQTTFVIVVHCLIVRFVIRC